MISHTYWESSDQQHLHVQFLGDKKGQTKGFYLEVWKINSVFFLSSISFELLTLNCLCICEGLYLCTLHSTAELNEIET